MAKLIRYQQCGCFHFVTFSCYRREPLLETPATYSIFEQELEAVRAGGALWVFEILMGPQLRVPHPSLLSGEGWAGKNFSPGRM